jgi:hypothetical protein
LEHLAQREALKGGAAVPRDDHRDSTAGAVATDDDRRGLSGVDGGANGVDAGHSGDGADHAAGLADHVE